MCWGVLTVSKGALMSAAFTDIRVAAPADASARPLHGDGWTLEMTDGWSLVRGERAGDYALKKIN